MARFNGYPGMGGGNMNQLLKQAKKMQEDMMKTQAEIEEKEFEVTSGGGAITLKMNGKRLIKSIKINPDVVDKDDVEMLEDLIMTAVNEGIKKAEEIAEGEMGKFNIPSGFKDYSKIYLSFSLKIFTTKSLKIIDSKLFGKIFKSVTRY